MYCSQCGNQVPKDARYCPQCKARQELDIIPTKVQTPEVRKWRAQYRGRKLGNLLVSIIALVILFTANKQVPDVPVFATISSDTSYIVAQNQTETVICSTEGEWCAIDTPYALLYNAEHTKMAYIDKDQELYYMDGVEPAFIDDYVLRAKLSFDGNTLVYQRLNEKGESELCICLLPSKSIERINIDNCSDFLLSLDGRSVAYLEGDIGIPGTLSLWQHGRNPREIASKVSSVLSVTDGGTLLFYIKDNSELCSYSWEREQMLASISGEIRYLLNETQTEILYTSDQSTYYYTAPMSEAVRLTGVKGTLFFSANTNEIIYPQSEIGTILGRRTLKNRTFVTYDDKNHFYKIYQLDRDGKEAELLLKTSAL